MARDAVLSDAEREEQIRELRAEARRATAQSEIEENARRWLETAGDDAAARASAFAAGGYLDPSRLRGGVVLVLGLGGPRARCRTRTRATLSGDGPLRGRDGAARRGRPPVPDVVETDTSLTSVIAAARRWPGASRRGARGTFPSRRRVSKASPCSLRATILASWALFRASAPPNARSTRSFSSSNRAILSSFSPLSALSWSRCLRVVRSGSSQASADMVLAMGLLANGSLMRREAASSIVGGHEIDQCRAFSVRGAAFHPRCPICLSRASVLHAASCRAGAPSKNESH